MSDNFNSSFKVKKGSVMRDKPWVVSTVVLVLLVVLLLAGNVFGITGKTVSSSNMEKLASDFIVNKLQVSGTVESVEKTNGLYQVNVNIDGESLPLYFTKDGNWIGQGSGLVSIVPEKTTVTENVNTQTETTSVPKSDKPVVELFVWGYCPYGVQAQGPLAEVVGLLGKYADFNIVMYYNGHGDYETQENKIQECIQELYPAKYWDYAAGFVKTIYPNCSVSRTVDCDKSEATKLMKSLGIDSTKVFSCVSTKGDELISTAFNYAKEKGVTGSPTLLVNGVKVNAARSAEAYKAAVCGAFNNAPSECSTALSSTSGTASGNC